MIAIDISKPLHGSQGEMKLAVNTTVDEGTFVAIAGKSGSGKTTLLRILAGLERAEGRITVAGDRWLDTHFSLPPQKREIGFVFQEYALFNNMTVEENLLFVKKDKQLASQLLALSELEHLKKRAPSSLSGGQKQRVSLCRAMMKRPKLLLMDEPLSALDVQMRSKLQQEILTMHQEFGTTTLMVSHDPSEIYRLANRLLKLENGKIIQDASPKKVLLKTAGSQKFSLHGEILDIVKVDVIYVAIVAIGQQVVEIVISKKEAKNLSLGQPVTVATKAFTPMIFPID